VLVPVTFNLVLYLLVRLEPTKVEPLLGLHSDGRLLALATNIRVSVTNTLAYCVTILIILLKRS
jgi:hypothetical protein